MDYMVKLSNERYNVLASWPDFTAAVSALGEQASNGAWRGKGAVVCLHGDGRAWPDIGAARKRTSSALFDG